MVMNTDLLNTDDQLPLVSIAMCTYHGERYLQEQIDTLLGQTYPNIEIVAVDDASTDNTVNILEENSKKDSRIRFFINEKNIGYNKNFEKAISLCNGQYIAVSDQDDCWEVNKIEVMMSLWPAGLSFIYSLSGTFIDTDLEHRTLPPAVVYTAIDDVHKLVFNSPVHGHACMFKKEFALSCMPFPDDIIYYDWWLSMHAAATGIVGYVPKALTWHRIHGKNSSKRFLSIKDKQVRAEQLRNQSIRAIETFCDRHILKQPQKESLLSYTSILKTMDGKKFSWPMFRYVLKNRKKIFHYKRQKPFMMFSYLKRAARMAYTGIL